MSLVSTAAKGSSPLTTKGDVFGFDTANARIPIGADNSILTADSLQTLGLKWAPAAGAVTQLFDSALAAPATSIDTGAAGIAQTANHLLIVGSVRGTAAAVTQNVTFSLNNDVSAIYDTINATATSTSPTTAAAAQNQAGIVQAFPAGNADAGAFGSFYLLIPDYRANHLRNMLYFFGRISTTGTLSTYAMQLVFLNYKSSTAVSRCALSSASNLATLSRLTVYGLT